MIDSLPEEVLNLIINNLEEDNPSKYERTKISFYRESILYVLSLRNVNRFFKNFIESQNDIWMKVENTGYLESYSNYNPRPHVINEKRSDEIEQLCLKNTSLDDFRWLFNNNLHLSSKNIQRLIIKNRIDVIKMGFYYEDFLKLVFNKFHLCSSNDLFGLSENTNPMMTAVRYDRVEIVKLFLESSLLGNPYLDQIESIFDESVKYIKTGTLNYLIVNHYERLKKQIDRKFTTLILRFNNIEDTLFYIVVNKKATINRDVMKSLISKNYIDLFKYCYKNENYDKFKNNSDFLKKCIDVNAFIIFDYLMENNSYINPSEFTASFLEKKKHNVIFFNMILDKYLDLIPLNSKLVSLSIKNKIDEKRLIRLLDKGYFFNEKDIIEVLTAKKINIAKVMINSYQ